MNTTTNTTTPRGESFINLVGDLQTDIKTLIKKENELAKTEMGEKFKTLGRNAGFAAAGGILGLFALFILLLGIGAIIARLLQKADLNPGTAYFLAYMGLALILGGVGYALIHKAMNAFSKLSLSPEKALETVRGPEAVEIEIRSDKKEAKESKRSSDEVRDEVVATRARMDSELNELRERLTPAYMVKSSFAGLKHHPLRALLVGASTGLGGYLLWRRRHQAELKRISAHRRWYQLKLRHA
jgi:hypothetical protein